jgi:hypothetical protein
MSTFGWIIVMFFIAFIYGVFLIVERLVNNIFEETQRYNEQSLDEDEV